MALPSLSPEERAQALAKAAEARQARAQLKSSLADGSLTLEAALNREDDIAKKTKVIDALKALPGVGNKRAAALMEEAGIAENRRFGGLGPRQRTALINAVSK